MGISINTSDIEEIKCDDGVIRSHLDTPDKLICLIKSRFRIQEHRFKQRKALPLSFLRQIDLSNCIIDTDRRSILPYICDTLDENYKDEEVDCLINNGYRNKYYQEIKVNVCCQNSIIKNGWFENIKFHGDVDFSNSHFEKGALFINCLFKKYVDFQKVTFKSSTSFNYCTFEGNSLFHQAKFKCHDIDFSSCTFNGEFRAQDLNFSVLEKSPTPYIDFRNSVFHKEVDLSYNKFDRACYFGNAKFHDNLFLRKTHFKISVCFYDTELEGNILFTSYPEEEQEESTEVTPNIIKIITFRRAKISGRIDFEKCEIESLEASFADMQKGALFRIYESKIKRLDFTSVYNDGVIMLEDNQDNIEEITFKSALNTGLIEIENTNTKTIKDRKTARLLKDSANKSGNTIDALHYKAKEMALYQKELIRKIKPSLGLKTLLSNLLNSIKRKIILSVLFAIPTIIIALISHQILYPLIAFLILSVFIWTSVGSFLNEIIVLILNTISNKNGLSWIRGVLFTLTVWVLFYGLFIMSRDGVGDVFFLNIEANREGFINYLWLPSGLNDLFIDNNAISWFTSVIFIVGKMAIAYGIYQTITAFRKYKN